jgi:hypothetical protein
MPSAGWKLNSSKSWTDQNVPVVYIKLKSDSEPSWTIAFCNHPPANTCALISWQAKIGNAILAAAWTAACQNGAFDPNRTLHAPRQELWYPPSNAMGRRRPRFDLNPEPDYCYHC